MSFSYECSTCHATQETPDSLCEPVALRSPCHEKTNIQQNLAAMCVPAAERIEFYCEGCGRPTAEPETVCLPTHIR